MMPPKPVSWTSSCWSSSNPCLRCLLTVPPFHNSVYEHEPGYTHDDWNRYRNPTWRCRPEPVLMLRVASGYWQILLVNLILSIFTCIYFVILVPLGAPNFANSLNNLFTMATFAVTLLMVFKLNTSYARWWEARTQWGTTIAAMRNYMRLLCLLCGEESRHVVDAAARWVPAAMVLLKEHVQEAGDGHAACKDLLTPNDLAFLEGFANKPLGAAHALAHLTTQAGIHPILQAQMQEHISVYVLMAAGNERILRTPIPTGYARFTARAILAYVCIVPLLLWGATGYLTPVVSVFVTFMVMGLENVTVQIEEPFRVLHLDSMCAVVAAAAKELQSWDGHTLTKALDILDIKGSHPAPPPAFGSVVHVPGPGSPGLLVAEQISEPTLNGSTNGTKQQQQQQQQQQQKAHV